MIHSQHRAHAGAGAASPRWGQECCSLKTRIREKALLCWLEACFLANNAGCKKPLQFFFRGFLFFLFCQVCFCFPHRPIQPVVFMARSWLRGQRMAKGMGSHMGVGTRARAQPCCSASPSSSSSSSAGKHTLPGCSALAGAPALATRSLCQLASR